MSTSFPKREGTKVPFLDSILGRVAGQILATLARRAMARNDWHEANHCIGALKIGASDGCGESCPLDVPYATGVSIPKKATS